MSSQRILVKTPPVFLELDFDSVNVKHDDSVHGQVNCFMPFRESEVFSAPIKDAKILVEEEDEKDAKIYLELTFDITDNPLDFLPGDTIGILPQNSDEAVNSFLELFRLNGIEDLPYVISLNGSVLGKRITAPVHIPRRSTLRIVARDCISFKFPPKKQFYRILHNYSEDLDTTMLTTLCAKDSNALETLLKTPELSIIEFIKAIPSCRPPITRFLEHLCRLQPKPYSIANSPLWNKNELKIALSILKNHSGETTGYIQNLSNKFLENRKERPKVWMYLRKPNTFRYTEKEFSKNIIMVSVGCAVAPFIGFMEHKQLLKKQMVHENPGLAWLFAGFKNPEVALYKNEIEQFKEDGIIDRVFESFSRDSECKQKYVQDHIMENAKEIVDLLYQDTLLYVCADGSEISKCIQTAVESAIVQVLNCSLQDAQEVVTIFKDNGKYREDIWV